MTKTLVVTGGAGFIGSHAVDSVLNDGLNAVVVDDLSTGEASRVPGGADLETVDISDAAALDRVVDACRPAGILHLAAQSSVTVSVDDPRRDCAVNVQGTLNVLEASKRHGAPVVFTSTGGALYGNAAPRPTPEDFTPAPVAPYGASKWAAEAYVNTWAEATGIPHAVCRLGNVYGPRQSPHGEAGVVAIIGYELWRDGTPRLYGFGEPTRDYIHVSDVVAALRRALGTRGTFNVATGVETSVKHVYSILERASGRDTQPDLLPLRPGELTASCLDPARARETLGWHAAVGIDEGIEDTYRALVADFEARDAAG
jgi:UDP-glucose 4-epimerase